MPYASIEDLKTELALKSTIDDGKVQAKLDEAQAIIERLYRRRFEVDAESEETRYVDCAYPYVDGRRLMLPWDTCKITSITNGDGEVITAADYVTEPRMRTISGDASIMPTNERAWPWYAVILKANSTHRWTYDGSPEEAIAVTGLFAFSATVPRVVKSATIRLAWWLYQRADIATGTAMPLVSKSGSFTTSADLPTDVQAALKGLKRI